MGESEKYLGGKIRRLKEPDDGPVVEGGVLSGRPCLGWQPGFLPG